ncbi:hypothetical protein [Marinospirillum perlucidum]|uniref:hypothetical protein n=1 Tax=Marinospirillum perlucidum TaxID=1982602 RepID=UPI0013900701|nr:hypothetical protein [Marinospirillum perlucidum]
MRIKRRFPQILGVTTSALLLTACLGGDGGSGSSSGSDTSDQTLTGSFVDSPVVNLAYSTASFSGRTNDQGEFQYKSGETVTFSIGDLELPAVTAGEVMSPLTLAGTTDVNNTTAVNIARLLQTLDADGDPDTGGIKIDNQAHESAAGLSIDFASSSFASDVETLINNSGSVTTSLVNGSDAIAHLQSHTRTLQLQVENQEGVFYDKGTRTLDLASGYTEADISGKSLDFKVFDLDAWTLIFRSGGTGSIKFSADDSNSISWQISDGKIIFTETDDYGDTWTFTLTPIETTAAGENILVEVTSPSGQEDFTRGAGLGTLGDDISWAAGNKITVDLSAESEGSIFYDKGSQELTIGTLFTEADISVKSFSLEAFDLPKWNLSFYDDDRGIVNFIGGDYNSITWKVTNGRLYYTETDDHGDSWSFILTPIERLPSGANILIEASTPEGQADSLNGKGLGVWIETN